MSDTIIYINGIFRSVLEEALAVQRELPEQVVYLQPHKSQRMVELADEPPSPSNPASLLASTTDDLNSVQYSAEIVGWRDKRELSKDQRTLLDRLIKAIQPEETGLYSQAKGSEAVNLLILRNLQQLEDSVPVNELVNARHNEQLSERTQAGGWVYIRPDSIPERAL